MNAFKYIHHPDGSPGVWSCAAPDAMDPWSHHSRSSSNSTVSSRDAEPVKPLRARSRVQRQDSGYESHLSAVTPRSSSGPGLSDASLEKPTRTRPTRCSTSDPLLPSPEQLAALFRCPNADSPEEPVSRPLPQTTHYWTSDSTRRQEYAAIDKASRGLSAWLRRHVIPGCLRGDDKHLAFDDDSGSVRRYRLQLDDEPAEEAKSRPTPVRPLFSFSRRRRTF